MKKTLIALAAFAAVSSFAQSTVTLFGRLDAGYNATTTTNTVGATTTETKSNGVQNAGLASNKWGMKGSEDLGGGLKANFVLEQSMDVVTGAATGFTRDSTVGVSGNFGEVRFGRSYTPLFITVGASDVFGTTGATTVNLYPDSVRASSSVFYNSPAMSGFSVAVMIGRNDAGVTTGATSVDANSDNTGLSATYAAGPLMVSVAMGEIKATAGTTSSKSNGSAVSATYDLGVAKLYGGYTTAKAQTNTAVATYIEQTELNLGVAVPMGATTLMAAYGRNTATATAAGTEIGNGSGNDFVVGASYAFSKRTSAYAKTGTYNKVEGSLSGVNAATKATTTALGVVHNF